MSGIVGRIQRLSVFDALRYRDYRMLWLASFLASLSLWTQMVGRGWLTFHESGSSTLVGLVTFAGMLPFLLAPVGGIFADRLDRRHLLATTSISSFALSSVMAILAVTGVITVWQVIVITLAMGLVRSAEWPATESLLPNLIPREKLLNAMSLGRLARFAPQALGPALAAPLLATVGEGGVFVLSAIFYLIAAQQTLRVRTPSRGEARADLGILQNFQEGVAYTVRTPVVAMLMIIASVHCVLTMSFNSLLPVFARDTLGAGGSAYSILTMSMGLGALAGTLALANITAEREQGQWFLITGILSGLTPIAMSVSGALPAAILALAAMGSSQQVFMTLNSTLLQSIAPDGLRGRVMSLNVMVTAGLMAWANLVNGSLADFWGAPVLFLALPLVYLVFLAGISGTQTSLRRIYRTGVPALP